MKHFIIGTAGHIDHGKTTLIGALTGQNTDRLPEEKIKGISIDIGFASFCLPSKITAGIIDVPGHEKFIKNMLAGAFAMDMVILVVAADSGLMPQSYEHIDILSYLGITKGVIAITKCDCVDNDYLDLVIEDTTSQLSSTFMKDFPIICVDSISRRGLNELIHSLDKIAVASSAILPTSTPRLYIDNIYSINGHGTVVSGTLLDGCIPNNSYLQLYPKDIAVRVRSIQVHSKNVDFASPAERTAINIIGVDKNNIKRGDLLTIKDKISPSNIINVELNILKKVDFALIHWTRLRIYHATSEILCRAVPLNKNSIEKGETGFVQLRLETPLYAKPYDKFVVRTFSPLITVGGGTILQTNAFKCKSGNKATINTLQLCVEKNIKKLIISLLDKSNDYLIPIKKIYENISCKQEELETEILELEEDSIIIKENNYLMLKSKINTLKESLIKALECFHLKKPLRYGIQKEILRKNIANSSNPYLFDKFLHILENNSTIKQNHGLIALKAHDIILNKEQQYTQALLIEEINSATLLEFKSEKELIKNSAEKLDILRLVNEDKIIHLADDFYISTELFNQAIGVLENYLKNNKTIDLKTYKDLLSIGRRNALVLLDTFDKKMITARQGDKRVLLNRR